jgi:ABC-type lipoprotein release transport system permease subunit
MRHRKARLATLGLGILVASVTFVLLTSAVSTGALRVKGTINRSFRPAYDILVRPPRSLTPLEASQGLVRDNYLSGIFGGISMKQYEEIKSMPGIDVAAPIANLGYIMASVNIYVPINRWLDRRPFQLYRVTDSWSANHGFYKYPGGDDLFVYYTPRYAFTRVNTLLEKGPPKGANYQVCGGADSDTTPPVPSVTGPFSVESGVLCFSRTSPGPSLRTNFDYPPAKGFVGVSFQAQFPELVSAIDPEQEARLVGLDRTVQQGRYLRESDRPEVPRRSGLDQGELAVPAIASDRTFVSDSLHITVQGLEAPLGTNVPRAIESGACLEAQSPCPPQFVIGPPKDAHYKNGFEFVSRLKTHVIGHRTYSLQPSYRRLTRLRKRLIFSSYWTSSDIHYRGDSQHGLVPLSTHNPPTVWTDPYSGYLHLPRDNQDVQFRRFRSHSKANQSAFPALRIVGRFDPTKLPGFNPLSRVPLETYYPPLVQPANAVSRNALGGRPLQPTHNLGGYISQPPLLLTTLKGMRPFFSQAIFPTDVDLAQKRAPISAIRVRVAAVHGMDPLSRERIRTVATAIHQQTGLPVDITAGSSPAPMLIHLPAGKFGSPALLVKEGWTKKGAAVEYLKSVNTKSLILFFLVLVACVLFLVNASLAAVRTRRTEIGTLLTLGWSRSQIFKAVLLELSAVGLTAGVVGMLIALVLVPVLNLDTTPYRTLLVVPLATALAALAGLLPARRASKGTPLDAITPPVQMKGEGKIARNLFWVAARNVGRLPARAVLGAAGLVIGVASLTVLVSLQRAFQTTVAGTLLGRAISIQVRGVDVLSVVLVIGLGAFSLADVLFLNILERRAELVTLRTLGWRDGDVVRLVALEGLGVGILGSVLGAALGLAAASFIHGVPILDISLGAALAAAAGIAASGLASLIPLARVSALTPPTILAEE